MQGLDLGLRPAAPWWPQAASAVWDFCNHRYVLEGRHVPPAAAFSFARAGGKYADDLAGDWHGFGSGVPARSSRGVLIEPAASNLVLQAALPQTYWSVGGASKSALPGTFLGLFADASLVASNGQNWHNLHIVEAVTLAAGTDYACRVVYRAGSSANALVAVERDGGGAFGYLDGPIGAMPLLYTSGLTLSGIAHRSFGDDVFETQFGIAVAETASFTLYMGPNSTVAGESVALLFGQLEAGTRATSPILSGASAATRAADALTLSLPDGEQDLTIAFDDGSEQEITGVSGDYLVPTDLDRPWIARITARASA